MGRRLLALLALGVGCGGGGQNAPPPPPASPLVVRDTTRVVQAEMRNVDFRIDSGIVLRIGRLRGALLPTSDTTPPTFDDRGSFVLAITGAAISIDTASLGNLLTRHVFAYPGSPLGRLRVSIEGDTLIQKGVLKKGIHLPFTVRAQATLTDQGMIRLHPTSIKVLGIGARGLMRFFGLNLEKLAKVGPGHGITIEGNDFLLDPAGILPPPRVKGRVTALTVRNGSVSQVFGNPAAADSGGLTRADSTAPNYMYFRGGTLRFGKLTMADADLYIVDADPSDRFDFYLARYLDQLVAGSHRTTRSNGLVVQMPDLRDLPIRRQ